MSILGEETTASGTSSSLFGDEASTNKSQSRGLFGDDADPWMPAPKKKGDLSQILDNVEIPDTYIDIFDRYSVDHLVPLTNARKMMRSAQLSAQDIETIISLLLTAESTSSGLSRSLMNLALVLVAMAQQNEELTLDGVDDRKGRKLPIPKLVQGQNVESQDAGKKQADAPVDAPTRLGHESGQTTLDPFLTRADTNVSSARSRVDNLQQKQDAARQEINDPWSPAASTSHTPHYETQEDGLQSATKFPSHSDHAGIDIDSVTIRALDGKEGLPLWKHINYEVKSSTRKSSVVRRYSDFAWLLECLLKQFPFRQIPLLPPKRLAVNGIHIRVGKQADIIFLEKRRRGLSRFVNALERHPVLKSDQLVTTFLTVPTELGVWRKQASLTIKEEFEDRYLSPDLERSLPQGIEQWMNKTINGLKQAIESFSTLTTLQERLIKRQEATGADLLRFSLSLNTFCEQEQAEYDILGKENGPAVVNGLKAASKHHSHAQQYIEQECRNSEDVLLEDLKRHRDTLFAMSELFLRHAKYSGDNIPSLQKRIGTNEAKLMALSAKPEAKEADKIKLTTSIDHDKATIVKLENRKVFIRECVWQELQYFSSQQVHISKLLNDMAGVRLKYARLHVDIGAAFVGDVEGLP